MTEGGPAEAGKRPSDVLLYWLILLMVLFWSLNFIIGKVALREFPSLLLACLRTTLAGAFMLLLYAWRGRRNPSEQHWRRADLPVLLFLGLFGVALNQLFFVLGLSRTSVAHSAIVISMTPMFVLWIAAASGLERITAKKMLGMAIALGGVALLNAAPANGSARPAVLGDVLIALASLAFAIFTVTGKRTSQRLGSVTVNTFGYVGGALMLAPVTLWRAAGFSFSSVSAKGWASLVYMALFPSVVCYLIYYYALTWIAASRVAAFSYLQPLIATLLAIPLLGETVTLPLMAGGALVFAGVYLAERA